MFMCVCVCIHVLLSIDMSVSMCLAYIMRTDDTIMINQVEKGKSQQM